jgi:hypothetical protein
MFLLSLRGHAKTKKTARQGMALLQGTKKQEEAQIIRPKSPSMAAWAEESGPFFLWGEESRPERFSNPSGMCS